MDARTSRASSDARTLVRGENDSAYVPREGEPSAGRGILRDTGSRPSGHAAWRVAPVTPSRADQPAERSGNEAHDTVLRDELRTLIRTWNPALTSLGDGTSLIASGLIDSLALFNLILWIETKSGRTIDAASIDAAREWDSIAAILRYLDRSPPEPRSLTSQSVTPERRQSRYQFVKYDPSLKRAVAEFQTGFWSPDPDRSI